ncbi:MAG: type II secretion system protein [Verrucomicrobiae bacterium]|nr:type II secretion system protein [Verrucomicrobiae bacterium]
MRAGSVRGFTLAEVLAALLFMAIVIPVAVEGLRVAQRAGQVGHRKAVAARVGERILNEWLVTGAQAAGQPSGAVLDGVFEYRWTVRTEPWSEDAMRQVTVEVAYRVQDQEYAVRLSTLVDPYVL